MRKTVFHALNSVYPGRITNKTNGITFRRWLMECNPDLADIIRSALGERGLDDYHALKGLAAHANDSSLQERVGQARRNRKVALARVIADQLNLRVDPEAMFDVQVRRIHEYKRRRQPAVGSLPIVTIVLPAISRKGARNQLRRERGVPAPPLYLRNGWRREEPALAQ